MQKLVLDFSLLEDEFGHMPRMVFPNVSGGPRTS